MSEEEEGASNSYQVASLGDWVAQDTPAEVENSKRRRLGRGMEKGVSML